MTNEVKSKIQQLQAGLPEGVHVVPAYDRTRLITGAIHTLTDVMWHEMVIASLAILLILAHVRSMFVICMTLPLAVLFSFLLMWVLRTLGVIDIQANIMSLAGITISIGILVDQAIVMVENATHHLKDQFGDRRVHGDIAEMVIAPCRTVGRPIFFSVMIMLLSFIPVFMLSGREGKLFHPLAFTKSFAMIGVAIISVTLVPALIPIFIKGRLRGEEDNPIVRSFINIYKPLLTWALPRRNLVMWMFAALLIMAAGMFPLQAVIGQGASEEAWRTTFLGVFALVTSLTVIFTTGKHGRDALHLLLAAGIVASFGIVVGVGASPWAQDLIESATVFQWLALILACLPLALLLYVATRTGHQVLWRSVSLVSLVLVGLWSYHFTKIGVTFMPPLDEGTLLDMPVTVPRASVTQAADDLKARDALLRGFPEVESVIGKSGRADTPTDPAPLDMVETFVNFRPKELWPKRVLNYDDAAGQVEAILDQLASEGFAAVADTDDRDTLVNNATQKALERFDETMRELSLRRYVEFDMELEELLTRFAIIDLIERLEANGQATWPAGVDRNATIDRMTAQLQPHYGTWLAKTPAIEDAAGVLQAAARELALAGVITNVVDSLQLRQSFSGRAASAVGQSLGADPPTLAGELFADIESERMRLWRDHVQRVNWELFDQATAAFPWYAVEELAGGAVSLDLLDGAPHAERTKLFAEAALDSQLGKPFDKSVFEPFLAMRDGMEDRFRAGVFLWPRRGGRQGDLIGDEMERVLKVPGWANIFTQPIINRIEMLSTGVRTDIGVKVFGPDLDTIDRVCKSVEQALKPLSGARDVLAAPIMGKGYIEIEIDRTRAARYGIGVQDIQSEIEVAMGGRAVTFTVEDRDRFPVRVRYARTGREDEVSLRHLLVSPGGGTGPMRSGRSAATPNDKMGVGDTLSPPAEHASQPRHAAANRMLIPLAALADVKIVEGPAVIKSENGSLLNYVTLNVRGRDIVGFVDEAQRVVAEKVRLPEGVHIEWSGEFEHQVRAARTLRIVFPAVIALIFIILYLTYNDLADAGLMMLAVPEALAGGAFFMFLFPKITGGWSAQPMDFSVAVWVGFIACFGMATETGIIMLVYLRKAIERRGGLENIESLEELRKSVIEGAVHRLRPKLLTEGVAIIAIFPMVFVTGVGAEILAPMALPVLGGLLISDEVVDLFLPVRFYWVRRARWLKLHAAKPQQAKTEHAPVVVEHAV